VDPLEQGAPTRWQGVAAGVPYVALPPYEERASAPVILAWHSTEPPRSEVAMAAALPMAALPAWRVYLGVPLHHRPDRRDLLQVFGHAVVQATEQVPAALRALGERLPLGDGSLGLLGGSIGATIAQLAVTETDLDVAALALVSPVIQLRSLVEVPGAAEESRSIADRLDFLARIDAMIERRPRPSVLVVVGSDDDRRFVDPALRLWGALSTRGCAERTSLVTVPGMGHAFGHETSDHAAHVDKVLTDWFHRHLPLQDPAPS
jgi:pimeloyl-ACP methyl ester carboxylesterase